MLQEEIARLRAELARERDRNALLAATVRQAIAQLPPVRPAPMGRSKSTEDPHVAMLDISDVHIGAVVDPITTGGLSEYGFDVFLRRGERLRKGLLRIVELHRKVYPVNVLYVNFLGDIVEGEGIYRGQPFAVDKALTEQVIEGARWLAAFLRDLAGVFAEVHVRCVSGNHGRGYRRGDNHPRTNWDAFVYRMMQDYLGAQQNVECEVSDTSYLAYHVPGHEVFRHVLIHGDQARAWMGIPFYGMERAGARLQSMLGLSLDYVHAGHHHNDADWPSNQVEFLLNGSWVGGSDMSINRLMRTSRPSQNFFLLHPRRGVVVHYRIQLEDRIALVPDVRGVYRVAKPTVTPPG